MIKTEMGMVNIKGNKAEILADFTCIARALFVEIDEISEEEIETAIEDARHPERLEILDLDDIKDSFKELLEGLLKEVKEDGKKNS